MDALKYILDKYGLDIRQPLPIEIPNVGRVTLAALFGELGYKVGAEVGTERGKFAEIICNSNHGVKLYCIDPYETYTGYRDYLDHTILDGAYLDAKKHLSGYDVEFVKEYSMDAVRHFADESLDFVYIDANHEWPYVSQDVYYWSKKVRPGGIVSGHDYYRSHIRDSKCHVKTVVAAYAYAFYINPWFILGADAKIPGTIRDNSRSWFWVKA